MEYTFSGFVELPRFRLCMGFRAAVVGENESGAHLGAAYLGPVAGRSGGAPDMRRGTP